MQIYDIDRGWKVIVKSNIAYPEIYQIGKGKNAYNCYDLCCGFDIETTNHAETKTAFMYIWQFSINGTVIIGRTWEDFFDLLEFLKLPRMFSNANIIIFIHNLGFEMSFLLPYLENKGLLKKVFAKAKYQPLEVQLTNGFIFRDSAALSGVSLSVLADNFCKTKKLVGDLDYTIERNHLTQLTDKELQYCINDVIILSEYADYIHNKYTRQNKRIPFTSTGIVRQYIKEQIPSKRLYCIKKDVSKLYPKDVASYNFTMKWLFRGGFTHAQTAICGDILTDIDSYDLTSAYPSIMLQYKFPMTEYEEEDIKLWDKRIKNENVSTIAIYTFYNITAKEHHVIESKHKIMNMKNALFENGRLAFATEITVMLTELDYKIYEMFYKWDKMEIQGMKTAVKKKLPFYLINSVAEFYKNKKYLKENKEDTDIWTQNYFESKGKLNSCYGMCVSRLNLEEITFKNGEWIEEQGDTYEEVIENQILSPYWGIYITAYCRYIILSNIYKCKEKALYSDTDSIKVLKGCNTIFNEYNEKTLNLNKKICNELKLDFEIYKDLGLFDLEETYNKFKTWGSKRYIYTVDDKTKAVIAGMPKKTIKDYVKENGENALYDNFKPEMSFFVSGKNAHTYHGESTAIINGQEMHTLGGCYIYSVPFTMTVEKAFLNCIYERKMLKC